MPTDTEIVNGISKRSQAMFEVMVDSYGGLIKSVVTYHLSFLPQCREECINDVLLSLWLHIDRFDPQKNTLKNWIAAVCKYKAIDYMRKYAKKPVCEQLDENSAGAAEMQSETDINSLLSCLKAEDRELFYRHYILGEKISEISTATDKSQNVLFNRLSRGRKKLRKKMGEQL